MGDKVFWYVGHKRPVPTKFISLPSMFFLAATVDGIESFQDLLLRLGVALVIFVVLLVAVYCYRRHEDNNDWLRHLRSKRLDDQRPCRRH